MVTRFSARRDDRSSADAAISGKFFGANDFGRVVSYETCSIAEQHLNMGLGSNSDVKNMWLTH